MRVSEALEIIDRWADEDPELAAEEIEAAAEAVRREGDAVCKVQDAAAIVEFLSEYSTSRSVFERQADVTSLRYLLGHADPFVRRCARERLILNFREFDLVSDLVLLVGNCQHGEDVLSLQFVFACALLNLQSAQSLIEKAATAVSRYPLPRHISEEVIKSLTEQGLNASKIFRPT
jgi:hypothetical protein